jgi:plastocyanin domain-containing protein
MFKPTALVFASAFVVVACSSAPATSSASTTAAASGEPQVVKLEVTSEGFVPKEVTVKKDVPVRLEVTRQTDRTCATELVMKEKNIHLALPLHETVTATFTPDKAGSLRYACGMDMISGVIVVQ